jgi:hypothetical protein
MPARGGRKSLHTPAYDAILVLLRKMREDAELTQEEVAKRLSRTRTYVTKCELGERRIDLLEWIEFCRACRFDPAVFLARLKSKRK